MIAAQQEPGGRPEGPVEELTANDYIKAKRLLTEIDDTIKALQDPNVGLSRPRWAERVSTVGELVER